MSTGNFYCKNTDEIYAIGMSYTVVDENDNEEIVTPDEIEFEETLEYIRTQLQEAFQDQWTPQSGWDYNRNYAGSLLGDVNIFKKFAGSYIEASLRVVSRAGYYDGACLDFDYIGYDTHCDSLDEAVRIAVENLEYHLRYDYKPGFVKIQANLAEKWLLAALDEAIEKLQSVFKQVCEHQLITVARFSNGETIYQKVEG